MTFIEFHDAIIKIDRRMTWRIESNTGALGDELLHSMISLEAQKVLVGSGAPDYDLAALLVQSYPSACRLLQHGRPRPPAVTERLTTRATINRRSQELG